MPGDRRDHAVAVEDRHAERDRQVHVQHVPLEPGHGADEERRRAPECDRRGQYQGEPAEERREARLHRIEPSGVQRRVEQHEVHRAEGRDAEAHQQVAVRRRFLAERPRPIPQGGDPARECRQVDAARVPADRGPAGGVAHHHMLHARRALQHLLDDPDA